MRSAPLTVKGLGEGKSCSNREVAWQKDKPCQMSGFCIYMLSVFCDNEVDREPAEDIEKAN